MSFSAYSKLKLRHFGDIVKKFGSILFTYIGLVDVFYMLIISGCISESVISGQSYRHIQTGTVQKLTCPQDGKRQTCHITGCNYTYMLLCAVTIIALTNSLLKMVNMFLHYIWTCNISFHSCFLCRFLHQLDVKYDLTFPIAAIFRHIYY